MESQSASARDLLMVSLSRFYSKPDNIDRVLPYLTCTSGVSLRLIDWFVTNYARKHNIVVRGTDPVTGRPTSTNLYVSYHAQLKTYSKQQFDPFRRRDRIMFHYGGPGPGGAPRASVETTIGQLNFFRWMLEHDMLDYVHAHAHEIEQDMLDAHRRGARAPDVVETGGRADKAAVAGKGKAAAGDEGGKKVGGPPLSPAVARRAQASVLSGMTRVSGGCTVRFG